MNLFSTSSLSLLLCGLIVGAAALCMPDALVAQSDPVDPRDENWKSLPEMGRMIGTIRDRKFEYSGEEFGSQIQPVGRVGTSPYGSWIISRKRADTSIHSDYPRELLLYSGQATGLPQTQQGQRIGPTLIGSESLFHASGDWNSDGYLDLFVDMAIYGDSSFGNSSAYGRLSQLVVFWGNAQGAFSLNDTTRIPSPGDSWMGARDAFSGDFDGDGRTDLLLWEAYYWRDSLPNLYPTLSILKGTKGKRWGDPGVPIFSGWQMTNLPSVNRIAVLDQDADGALDIAFHEDRSEVPGYVAMLYGRRGAFPDTTEVEGLQLLLANGHYSLFSDITGDGAPELLVNTGTPELIRIYAGRLGQRLKDQYGSGYDPPIEGKGWWRRPWVEIHLPNTFDTEWTPAGWGKLYDLGDANRDGIDDIWAFSYPYLICYTAGEALDELVDGLVFVPGTEAPWGARLGVIDSTGVPVIAIGFDTFPHAYTNPFPGGVLFVKSDSAVPAGGYPRRLPDLPRVVDVRENHQRSPSLNGLALRVAPNPATGNVLLTWQSREPVMRIALISLLGEELRRVDAGALRSGMRLDISGLPAGTYFLVAQTTTRTESVPLIID